MGTLYYSNFALLIYTDVMVVLSPDTECPSINLRDEVGYISTVLYEGLLPFHAGPRVAVYPVPSPWVVEVTKAGLIQSLR